MGDVYSHGNFTGSIAIVERGLCSFDMQVAAAESHGLRGLIVVDVVGKQHFKIGLNQRTSLVVISLAITMRQLVELALASQVEIKYTTLPEKWRSPLAKSCKQYETCQPSSTAMTHTIHQRVYMSCPAGQLFSSLTNQCKPALSVRSCNYYGELGGYMQLHPGKTLFLFVIFYSNKKGCTGDTMLSKN